MVLGGGGENRCGMLSRPPPSHGDCVDGRIAFGVCEGTILWK